MGGCGRTAQQRHSERAAIEKAAVAPAARPGDLVGDADRRRRSDLVGRAFAEGLLELGELEQVLERVLRARTVADLDAATEILPEPWLAASRRSELAAQRAAARRAAQRREARGYLGGIALLVAIWCLIALATGATYFWPIWPALGWGIPLLLGRLGGDHERQEVPEGPLAGLP